MSYYVKRDNGVVVAVARTMQYEEADDGPLVPAAGWDATPLADDDPEVVGYFNYVPPPPTPGEMEADALAALDGGTNRINLSKLIKAKVISDEAYRLGKAPGALTGAELSAIRNRIAAIYKVL